MKKSFTAKSKILLTVILTLIMAFSVVTSVACKKKTTTTNNNNSTTTTTITERTDNKLLKNGDFEFGTANTKLTEYPVYSSINWTKSNDSMNNSTASSSSYASGIIDTREYKYSYDKDGYVALENGQPVLEKDENGNPIKAYHQILSNKSSQFEDFIVEYEKDANGQEIINADGSKNPVYYNPHSPSYYGLTTYDVKDEDGLTGGGKVLMINNHSANDEGAAQYFSSSSSLTLNPGENGRFDVWVLTKDISSKLMTSQTEIGAYIHLETTVGSITSPATRIKNIITNGEWAKFSVYIVGSNFAKTTISLRLGLGIGSKDLKAEYAEGYAFFDDASFTVLDKDEVLPTSYDLGSFDLYDTANVTLEESKFTLNNGATHNNALFNTFSLPIKDNTPDDATDKDYKDYKYLYTTNFTPYDNYSTFTYGINCAKPETGFDLGDWNNDNKSNYEYLTNSTEPTLNTDSTFSYSTTDKALIFNSKKPANIAYTTDDIPVPGLAVGEKASEKNYLKISFWVKTEFTTNGQGLTIQLIDKGTISTAESNYQTITLKINGSESGKYVTKKGVNTEYGDFVKVTVVVQNTFRVNPQVKEAELEAVPDRNFALKFIVGPTAPINDKMVLEYPIGKAIIKDFTTMNLTSKEVESLEKETDKSVTERTLQADLSNINTESTSTDTYKFNYGKVVHDISKGIVSEVNTYTSVVGNHKMVGGEETTFAQNKTISGLINTANINVDTKESVYYNSDPTKSVFGSYQEDFNNWLKDSNFDKGNNKYMQPLIINNLEDNVSFGYIGGKGGSPTTISANSTAVISVKVKVFGGATAYIYLSNAEDKSTFSILGINAKNTKQNQEINHKYAFALNAAQTDGLGYTEVKLVIKTGEKALKFNVELWNGPRQFAEGTEIKKGLVIFDDYSCETGKTFSQEISNLKAKFSTDLVGEANSYSKAFSQAQKFTKNPIKVLTDKNPNGETREYNLNDEGATTEALYFNDYFLVADLTTIDTPAQLDERTPEDSSDDTTTTPKEESSYNPWLFATSLIVTIALIVALLAIVVKKIIDVVKKKKANKHSYYDKDAREKTIDNINKKKNDAKFKEEYDYDNIESNLIEEGEEITETEETVETEATDATTTETTEETTETAQEQETEPSTQETSEVVTEEAQETSNETTDTPNE